MCLTCSCLRGPLKIVVFSYDTFVDKATPIYLLVLRAQEVGNEPFWNKKKVEICDFFNLFFFIF